MNFEGVDMETLSANMVRQLLEQGEVVEALSKLIAQKVIERLMQCQFKMVPGFPQMPKEFSSSSPTALNLREDNLFCRITKAAYDKGKAQVVEAELRSASVSAPKLIKAIRTNEALGYLDTQNLSSTEMFRMLKAHFKPRFDLRAFQLARSK